MSSPVFRALRWTAVAVWRESKDIPGGGVLLAVATPVAIAFSMLGGWVCGELVGEGDDSGLRARGVIVMVAIMCGFLALWGEGAEYVTERAARDRRRLATLPLHPSQLYAIAIAQVMGVLGMFVLPFALACGLALAVEEGKPLLGLVLTLGTVVTMVGSVAGARLLALAAVSVPPRLGGWPLAVAAPLVALVFGARPLGEYVRHNDGRPLDDASPLVFTRLLPGDDLAREPLLGLLALLALTALLLAIDAFTFRRFVLRHPDLFAQRAVRGGQPPPAAGLHARWARARSRASTLLRALLRKEAVWLARQRSLLLVPLVVVTVTGVVSAVFELVLPISAVLPHASLAVNATAIALVVCLFFFGAVYAAASVPAEGPAGRRLLELPVEAREVLRERALSVLPMTLLSFEVAWVVLCANFADALQIPAWLTWAGGPLLLAACALITSYAGVAIGILCPRRSVEHPLFSVNLLGLGGQASLSAASGLCFLLGVPAALLHPLWLLAPLLGGVLLIGVAAFLHGEAVRRLKAMRLEPW